MNDNVSKWINLIGGISSIILTSVTAWDIVERILRQKKFKESSNNNKQEKE